MAFFSVAHGNCENCNALPPPASVCMLLRSLAQPSASWFPVSHPKFWGLETGNQLLTLSAFHRRGTACLFECLRRHSPGITDPHSSSLPTLRHRLHRQKQDLPEEAQSHGARSKRRTRLTSSRCSLMHESAVHRPCGAPIVTAFFMPGDDPASDSQGEAFTPWHGLTPLRSLGPSHPKPTHPTS